jgi:tetratricopeptide (TPR) repeat protein
MYMIVGTYDKCIDVTKKAISLEPDYFVPYLNISQCYLGVNQLQQARAITEEAVSKFPDSPVHLNAYGLAFLASDPSAMAHELEWSMGRSGMEDWMLSLQSDTEAYFGRLGKGQEYSSRAVASARKNRQPESTAKWLAQSAIREALFGNPDAARQGAASALVEAPDDSEATTLAALAYAMAGDSARAESLAADLSERFPQDEIVQNVRVPVIRAQIDIDRNNGSRAVEILEPARRYELGQLSQSGPNSCLYPIYLRGVGYLSERKSDAAMAEFQRMLDYPGILWNCPTGSLARLGLARSYAMEGEIAKAKTAYQDFLTLWKDADPDIPIYKQAKAEYARLQ